MIKMTFFLNPVLTVWPNRQVARQSCITPDALSSGQTWYCNCISLTRLAIISSLLILSSLITAASSACASAAVSLRDLSPPHFHPPPPPPLLTHSLTHPHHLVAASFNQQPENLSRTFVLYNLHHHHHPFCFIIIVIITSPSSSSPLPSSPH